jgi:hypothetical protein
MPQRINLTQTDLNEIAAKATQLDSWLEEKALFIAARVAIPSEMTIAASVFIAAGVLVLMDGALPDGGCWSGKGGCST